MEVKYAPPNCSYTTFNHSSVLELSKLANYPGDKYEKNTFKMISELLLNTKYPAPRLKDFEKNFDTWLKEKQKQNRKKIKSKNTTQLPHYYERKMEPILISKKIFDNVLQYYYGSKFIKIFKKINPVMAKDFSIDANDYFDRKKLKKCVAKLKSTIKINCL